MRQRETQNRNVVEMVAHLTDDLPEPEPPVTAVLPEQLQNGHPADSSRTVIDRM